METDLRLSVHQPGVLTNSYACANRSPVVYATTWSMVHSREIFVSEPLFCLSFKTFVMPILP